MAEVSAAVDGGAGGGKLQIYNGTRPSTGGTATTLLAELTFASTSFGAPSSGVINANSISADTDADATGTATWFRVTDSVGGFVMDGDVGVTGSGADLELNSVNIGAGQRVEVTSFQITEGNP
jgi:hypothetical protein